MYKHWSGWRAGFPHFQTGKVKEPSLRRCQCEAGLLNAGLESPDVHGVASEAHPTSSLSSIDVVGPCIVNNSLKRTLICVLVTLHSAEVKYLIKAA